MADFESRIRIGIDNSQALEAIKALQREISVFQTSMARGTAAQQAAASKYQQELVSSINATGKFSANIRSIQTTTESFTNSLEKNKLSFGQYFRYAAASTKTFGRSFQNELEVINKTARERVKDLQTQYVKLGRDASGAMQAIAIRPLALDLDNYATKTAVAAQKQQILNQLLKQGSTNLLNFGKNTQWAGRQLMVGFTIPLSIFGSTAAKSFMKLEEQAIKFRKVYGDLFTTGPERDQALQAIRDLADGFTQYGVAVADTIGIAAEAAAAGFKSIDLQRQTEQAIRLSVLGQLEQQKALETTISLQNAFQMSSENLAESINFLNAVENQTVVSLDDITTAVPKVAPVIQSLGGDVKDLAFFLAAMKEGGVNASEGANALKSGLASLINPTEKASQMLSGFGINIRDIVTRNAGDLKRTVLDFALALDELDPLVRAQAIEQLFGKFQFARLSTLFDNVVRDGSQAARVLDLATASAGELADMAEKELGMTTASAMNKFKKAVEDLQAAMAPIGELFLEIVTPLISFGTDVLKSFNNLDEGVKKFLGGLTGLLGVIGPIAIMTFGLLANGIANIIKGFLAVRNVFQGVGKNAVMLGEQTEYMTQKQLEELAVAASLEQAHMKLAQAFTSETAAIDKLVQAYDKIILRQRQFSAPAIASSLGRNQTPPVKMKDGGVVTVPGPRGAGDIVPAMLSPGEAVIPSKMAAKYAPLIQGMIAGNIPGFAKGVFLGMPRSGKGTAKDREAGAEIYEKFKQSRYANVPPREYGHQLAKTTGHSFPIFGLGGVYMSPEGKKVFVKPVLDETAAVAEMRATRIAREAHGLKAPAQRIVVMRDPTDIKRERKFLALESDLDATFVNNDPMAVFNEGQYFKQLVASLLRVDKDLSASNVFKDVVADVGPAGVFSRASGQRDYADNLPSMEKQAMINLLGIKGGAKRAFAESTLGLMSKLTPQQYHQRMIAEIQQVLPLLKQTVASFGLTDPREVKAYSDMIQRLEAGLGVDWSKFHAIHSSVKIPKNKQSSIPGYANGVVSVPGPKGKGDVVPAMLSPGEAVIPADKAEKYASLINAMIAGNIPGFIRGKKADITKQFQSRGSFYTNASHVAGLDPESLMETMMAAGQVDEEFGNLEVRLVKLVPVLDELGKQVEINGKKQLEAVETVKRVRELTQQDVKDQTAFVRGQTFGGTTVLESAARNSGAYEASRRALARRGIDAARGASFTLQDAISMGEGAQLALDDARASGKDMATAFNKNAQKSAEVQRELELLVVQAREAREALASSSSIEKQYSFSRDKAVTVIQQALRRDTAYANETERAAEAQRRVAAVDREYARLRQSGLDEVEALTRAQAMLQGKMISASTAVDGYITVVSGQGSASKFALRPTAQFGKAASRGYGIQGGPEAISVGRGPSASDLMAARVQEIRALGHSTEVAMQMAFDEVMAAAYRGLQINSPSGAFEDLANNVAAGVDQSSDNALAAGEDIGKTIATSAEAGAQSQSRAYRIGGGRRVTTDRGLALASAATLFRPENDATAILRDQLNPVVQQTKTNFDAINGTILQTSFAFSSIASLASMFGSELGGATQLIYGLSSALMALTAIVEIARVTELKRIAINKAGGILELIKGIPGQAVSRVAAAKQAANVTKIFEGGIAKSFSNLVEVAGGLGGTLGRVASIFVKFVPILLAAFAAFQAFQIFDKLFLEPRRNLEALSKAALLSADALSSISNIIGAGLQPLPFSGSQLTQAPEGVTATDIGTAAGIRQTEEFKALIGEGGDFQQQFDAIKNASLADAEKALTSLVVQILAQAPKDVDKKKVEDFVRAVALEAGKGQADFAQGFRFDPFSEETTGLMIKNAEDTAERIKSSYQSTMDELNAMGGNIGFFQTIEKYTSMQWTDQMVSAMTEQGNQLIGFSLQLRTQLANNIITADEYRQSLSAMFDPLREMPEIYGLETLMLMLQKTHPEIAPMIEGIDDMNAALEIAQTLLAGGTVSEEDIKLIDAGDNLGATQADLTKKEEALARVQKERTKAVDDLAKSQAELQQVERKSNIKVSTKDINDQIAANEELLGLYPGLIEALGSEEEAIRAVSDEKIRKLLLDAKEQDLIDGGTANYDAVVASLNQLEESERAVNNARATAEMGAHLDKLREQNGVLSWLTQNGMGTAQALQVIGNSTLYAGAAAAKASGSYDQFVKDMKEILSLETTLSGGGGGGGQKSPFEQAIENLREQRTEAMNLSMTYTKLRNAKLSANQAFAAAQDPIIAAAVATTKVGTPQWAKLVRLIKQADGALKRSKLVEVFAEREASNSLLNAFTKITPLLSKFGLSLEDIEGILNDPNLARAFFDDLKDGKINTQKILDLINQIPETKKIQLAFDMATPEGMMEVFDEAFSRQMSYLDLQERQVERTFKTQEEAAQAGVDAAQERIDTIQKNIQSIETRIEEKQRQIELTITRPIEVLNNSIESIERDIELNFNRPIAALQEESSDLSNELQLMDRQADEINKRFDAQAESLQKVNELAADAAAQDKERLDIADALASGNVADAVRAMRRARQEEQKRARERAAKALEIARENELAKIRSTSGLTREQIEQRQFEISQQIFSIEEQREKKQAQIQVIQDQIYNIELNRRKLLDEIRTLEDEIYTINNTQLKDAEKALETAENTLKTVQDSKQAKLDEIEAQRGEWELLRDQADEAMFKSNGYLTSLTNAKNMVEQIKKAWEAVGTVTPTSVANIVPTGNTGTGQTGTGQTGTGQTGDGKKINPAYTAAASALDTAKKRLSDWDSGRNALVARISKLNSDMKTAPPAARPNFQKQINDATKLLNANYNSSDRGMLNKAVSVAQAKLSSTPQYLAGGGMMKRFAAGGKIGYYPMGGLIPYKAQGGMFKSINTDTVPAMLTPGEFVVKRFAVEKFGEGNLKAINNGTFKGNSVYNYEVNVNVKSEANPDQIARAVMTQIKQVDAQRIRGNRF